MVNYYDILGVPQTANITEIKAAFRKLAKQYHPDRNPNGKEFFERALTAYETLCDPVSKATYDYKLRVGQTSKATTSSQPKQSGKSWKFDEREMKRRQYYNEHIRKYAKETATYNAQAREKKAYNEYKYILLATPLAVLLFVMIMRLAGPVLPKPHLPHRQSAAAVSTPQLKPGDSPYNFIFGNAYHDTSNGTRLLIKNMTGFDAIICIFSDELFVRSFFIQGGYSAEVSQLPRKPMEIRYAVGEKFSYQKRLKEARVMGGFTNRAAYYRSSSPFVPGENAEISLTPGISDGFVKTGEKEFFETTQ